MVIRLIFRETDHSLAANGIDDFTSVVYKSFNIEAPDIEAWLAEKPRYTERMFVGIEYTEGGGGGER